MFITVRRKSKNLILNSNLIKSVSTKVALSKMDSNGINEAFFKACIEDFDNNIYYTHECSCKNGLNYTEENIEKMILSIIEALLNSDNNLNKCFTEELENRLSLELNKYC